MQEEQLKHNFDSLLEKTNKPTFKGDIILIMIKGFAQISKIEDKETKDYLLKVYNSKNGWFFVGLYTHNEIKYPKKITYTKFQNGKRYEYREVGDPASLEFFDIILYINGELYVMHDVYRASKYLKEYILRTFSGSAEHRIRELFIYDKLKIPKMNSKDRGVIDYRVLHNSLNGKFPFSSYYFKEKGIVRSYFIVFSDVDCQELEDIEVLDYSINNDEWRLWPVRTNLFKDKIEDI